MGRGRKIDIHAVRRILTMEWNPIGIKTRESDGEYDGYIASIRRLLHDGADLYKMTKYLYQQETLSMGLRGDRERCERIAKLLLDL